MVNPKSSPRKGYGPWHHGDCKLLFRNNTRNLCTCFQSLAVGNCKSGDNCKFAHGHKELVKLDPPKIEDGDGVICGSVAFSPQLTGSGWSVFFWCQISRFDLIEP